MLRRAGFALLLCLAALPAAAGGSSPRAVPDAAAQEILDLRERLRAAAARKDRVGLENLYADNFQHLRDTGRIDLKNERVALLLAGDDGIETAPEEEMAIEVYGSATAVAVGRSRVRDTATGQTAPFRWLSVYVRGADGWRVALSQATRASQGR